MVLTPTEAINTFVDCEMDTLVLGNYIYIRKIFNNLHNNFLTLVYLY